MTALVEINVDEVDAIFASSKTRGNYDRVMVEFLEKGIQGAGVPLEGPFADRQLNSLKTGFESARNRVIENKDKQHDDATVAAARKVEVVIHNEGIYLLNRSINADSDDA